MYYLSYLIKCIMYIKNKLLVIERVFWQKLNKETCFFAMFTLSAEMRHMQKCYFEYYI